jgi:hypothetical protein
VISAEGSYRSASSPFNLDADRDVDLKVH